MSATKVIFNVEYLTAKEVAIALGVAPRTLSRWHHSRKGPRRIKVGNQLFYRAAAVRQWLDDNEL